MGLQYPTDEVYLEVDRLLETYAKVEQYLSYLPNFRLPQTH